MARRRRKRPLPAGPLGAIAATVVAGRGTRTQEEVARKAGIDVRTLRRVEYGEPVSRATLRAVGAELGFGPDWSFQAANPHAVEPRRREVRVTSEAQVIAFLEEATDEYVADFTRKLVAHVRRFGGTRLHPLIDRWEYELTAAERGQLPPKATR